MATAVRGVNPIWWIPDLVGNPLDDTYYMFVLNNEIPYQPLPIWSDENESIVRANPIEFLANGALPVDVFYDPAQVYRLEIRNGPTQSDQLIWLVEDYIPGEGGTVTPGSITNISDNQITNGQFALVNFETNLSRTVGSGTHELPVAPGWTLVLEGAGTYTIRQQPLTNSPSTPTGAPYALRVTLNGFDSAMLYQRFDQNGVIWANRYVAVNMTAKIDNGNSSDISWGLVDSMGAPVVAFGTQTVTTAYNEYRSVAQLGTSTNTDVPPDAWMDFQIGFNGTVDLFITSLQLVSKSGMDGAEVQYTEDTVNRQIDYTFHYYRQGLMNKPVNGLLVGWDFPMNPTQMEGGASGNIDVYSGTNYNAKYIWDQTIAGRGASGAVAYSRNSTTGGLQFDTSGTNDSFWVCQYMTGKLAKKMIGNPLSVNVNAYKTAASGDVRVYVYLYSGTAAATIPSMVVPSVGNNQIFVTTISAAGGVSGAGTGWTPIPRDVVDNATHTLSSVSTNADIQSDANNYALSGWNLSETQIADHDKFAILTVFVYTTASSQIVLNSVNLCQGTIPSIPAPKTTDDTLRECQHYYSKTYEPATPAGTITTTGVAMALMRSSKSIFPSAGSYYNSDFSVTWEPMRTTPTIYFYSPTSATQGLVLGALTEAGAIVAASNLTFSSHWTDYGASTHSINYFTTDSGSLATFTAPSSLDYPTGVLLYHCVRDARYGIV